MAYVIHVTTGDKNLSEQIEGTRQWALKHGHTIVTVIHEDHAAAFSMRDTLGGEVIETTPEHGPAFVSRTDEEGNATEVPLASDGPPPVGPPVEAKGEGAPSMLRPAVKAGAPPPVGPPLEGPEVDLESIVAPVEPKKQEKAAKKGTRRSGPTTKNRQQLERLKPIMDEYTGQSAKACAKMLNERGVLLPSGIAGTWQGTQVTRVRKHLEEIYGKPDSPAT